MIQKKILIILISFVAFSFYFYSIITSGLLKPTLMMLTLKNLQNIANFQSKSQIKHVLFYTTFWQNKYWDIGNETVGSEHPQILKCSAKNCIFTHKKTYLKNIKDYDAIIFHTGRIWSINKVYWKVPNERKPSQLYIVAVQE